jgi:hypothetical protein
LEHNENTANYIQNKLNMILHQNYFQPDDQHYKQNTCLAMEGPTSEVTAKQLKHTHNM